MPIPEELPIGVFVPDDEIRDFVEKGIDSIYVAFDTLILGRDTRVVEMVMARKDSAPNYIFCACKFLNNVNNLDRFPFKTIQVKGRDVPFVFWDDGAVHPTGAIADDTHNPVPPPTDLCPEDDAAVKKFLSDIKINWNVTMVSSCCCNGQYAILVIVKFVGLIVGVDVPIPESICGIPIVQMHGVFRLQ